MKILLALTILAAGTGCTSVGFDTTPRFNSLNERLGYVDRSGIAPRDARVAEGTSLPGAEAPTSSDVEMAWKSAGKSWETLVNLMFAPRVQGPALVDTSKHERATR